MKTDIKHLMEADGLDALLILGPARHNPAMYYFTGGGHISEGALVITPGQSGVLYCSPMERDEAAQTGLQVEMFEPLLDLLDETEGDRDLAVSLRISRIFEKNGITSGRVAIGGKTEVGPILRMLPGLKNYLPEVTIIGMQSDSIIRKAMATKDPAEIERIQRIGTITVDVVGNTADFLSGHHSKEGVLVKSDGQPLTIGDVKNRINRELSERGAENPHGTIFAAGRDAGVPHSAGVDSNPVPIGETIVFDIFPCEEGGGYFYDLTRTWCLGHAPDEAHALHQDVLDVYKKVVNRLEPDTACEPYQELTCALFEARQHPTIQSDPYTDEGYTHSLGHGLGLYVHELPHFGQLATEADVLSQGSVFTIEPGLYYPDRGMGVRLENTYQVNDEGGIEILADYPLDLVLPIAGQA